MRLFHQLTVVLHLITAVSLCTASATDCFGERPNILIITVDDMNADSLGAFGCKLADTSPNIDRLAKQSMRFEFAHVQVGNCMPSRNVMWSGKFPHNNGVEGFYQVKDAKYPVLADVMHEAGYFTAIRGKVSHSTPYHPYQWDLVLDTLPNGERAHTKDAKSYGKSTKQAIEAATQSSKPFCLMVNISDPHKPFYGQAKNGATFDDPHVPTRIFTADEVPIPGFLFDDPIVRKELAQYYSSVRRADDCVGHVLNALKAAGKTDNTFIMFLSDHGMPLPFAKTQLYHHSTRTPLFVLWPGVTKANSIDDKHMVSAVDFLPTLLDVAEIKHPTDFDGRSFAPILQGKTQADRDHVLKIYNENSGRSRDPMRGIQTKNYLYLFNPWSNGERVMATATTGTQTCRRLAQLAASQPKLAARHKLYQHRVVEELYDVQNDPDCLHNLIASPGLQNELDSLRNELQKQLASTGDHILPVFQQRSDAKVREAYVREWEQKAESRSPARGNNKRPKRKLISVGIPKAIFAGKALTIRVKHQLPKNLGMQDLHVTLKDGKSATRIERKVVKIMGTGVAEIAFDVPANVAKKTIQIAAFVGVEFKQNLQHVLTPPIEVNEQAAK